MTVSLNFMGRIAQLGVTVLKCIRISLIPTLRNFPSQIESLQPGISYQKQLSKQPVWTNLKTYLIDNSQIWNINTTRMAIAIPTLNANPMYTWNVRKLLKVWTKVKTDTQLNKQRPQERGGTWQQYMLIQPLQRLQMCLFSCICWLKYIEKTFKNT